MAFDREARPARPNRGKRRKVCQFCADKCEYIDYKDAAKLRRFVSERSKILPRRTTGSALHFQRQHHGAFGDLVAQLHFQFLHHTSMAGGDLHGGLVGLHGDQALLGLNAVARLDQHFDHTDFGEIANVGHFDVDDCHVSGPRVTSRCGGSPPAARQSTR